MTSPVATPVPGEPGGTRPVLGFGSAEAFSRAFKLRFGSSPTAWRRAQLARGKASNSNPDQVLSPALTTSSLAQIGVPVRIVVGSKDDQAIPEFTSLPVAATIPKSELEVLPGVTHYSFLPTCTLVGCTVARQICSNPEGVDRDAVHNRVSAQVLEFFNRAQRPQPVGAVGVPRP